MPPEFTVVQTDKCDCGTNRQMWLALCSRGYKGLQGCTLFKMRNTFCWTVRMNILLASAHSTASWSSHLNMKIAQLV